MSEFFERYFGQKVKGQEGKKTPEQIMEERILPLAEEVGKIGLICKMCE